MRLSDEQIRYLVKGTFEDIKEHIKKEDMHLIGGAYHETALIAAARRGRANGGISIPKYLLESGSDIDAVDRLGLTPCTTALDAGNFVFAEYCISHGCDIYIKSMQSESVGSTTIEKAIIRGAKECLWLIYKIHFPLRNTDTQTIFRMTDTLQSYLNCESVAYIVLGIRKFRSSILNTNDKHVILLIAKEIMKTKQNHKWTKETEETENPQETK
jgi:hypothetical protein